MAAWYYPVLVAMRHNKSIIREKKVTIYNYVVMLHGRYTMD